jgi:hypothetical protein
LKKKGRKMKNNIGAKELYLNERLKVKASSFATHILHMAMINKETGEVEYEVNKDVRFKNPKKIKPRFSFGHFTILRILLIRLL